MRCSECVARETTRPARMASGVWRSAGAWQSATLMKTASTSASQQTTMSSINNTIAGLELAQIGWVVPDIHAAVKFLTSALGIAGFPEPARIRALSR